MITEAQYKSANKAGLKHSVTGDMWSYYTRSLQVAYNLGLDGISLENAEVVTGFRFGGTPANFISHNYATNCSECGLSIYLDGDTIRAEFEERGNRKEFTGLVTGTGGDDETVILAFDADYLD